MKKSELKQIIREEINMAIEEGFWDTFKAKMTGKAASSAQMLKNFNALLKGKPGATVDTDLVKAITMLKSRMQSVPTIKRDLEALFPEETLTKLDPAVQKAISGYKRSLDGFEKQNANVLKSLEKLKLPK
jgi:hypothetical protein